VIGELYFLMGDYTKALSFFRDETTTAKDDYPVLFNVAICYYFLGE